MDAPSSPMACTTGTASTQWPDALIARAKDRLTSSRSRPKRIRSSSAVKLNVRPPVKRTTTTVGSTRKTSRFLFSPSASGSAEPQAAGSSSTAAEAACVRASATSSTLTGPDLATKAIADRGGAGHRPRLTTSSRARPLSSSVKRSPGTSEMKTVPLARASALRSRSSEKTSDCSRSRRNGVAAEKTKLVLDSLSGAWACAPAASFSTLARSMMLPPWSGMV
mmetsp:Transcript_3844/g.9552  ORF Transcript_3844/g.9552 Transcript_3844/m.9552 type:complete len:222 (+) Transcript_3844:434-1099(+)